MDASERAQLVRDVADALAERGVPQGTWLIDIGRAREDLRRLDELLRRLESAIVTDHAVER
jgi:hypothetical protein